jgi:Mce-associated membrane protein
MSVDTEADAEAVEDPAVNEGSTKTATKTIQRAGGSRLWRRVLVYGVLPGVALILALAAGYAKWIVSEARISHSAATESVRAATDGAAAMLSYHPDTVEHDLSTAQDRLTGGLKDSYASLIRDVVIPGSKQKQISATASVPAAASVMASPNHAVVLIFVNQTISVGTEPPTDAASRVRVTLDKVNGRWLLSGFDPI